MKRSSQHHNNEEEEEDDNEEKSSSSSSSAVAAAAKRSRKSVSKPPQDAEPDVISENELAPLQSIKPRKHFFNPSMYTGELLNYFRTGGHDYVPKDVKRFDFDHLQPHSKKDNEAWGSIEKDDKITLINEIVKLVVMRVHSGQTILDASTINDFLKSKGKKISHKTVLYYARLPLLRLFGYEIVPCFEPGKREDETDQLVIKDGQYVVRLASHAAGGEDERKAADRLQRHEVDLLARGKTMSKLDRVTDRAAARQGLLMAVLTFIVGSIDMKVPEGDLFAYLMRLDKRLPPPTGKGSGATIAALVRGGGGGGGGGGRSSLDVDNEDDGIISGDSGDLRDWVKIIRDEFTGEKYIEAVKVEGSAEAAAQAAAEGANPGRARDAYVLGVRGRAVIGVLGIYEYASSLREMDAVYGASKVIAPEQMSTKDSVGTILKLEIGDFVKHLPVSVLAKKAAQAAGIEVDVVGLDEDEDDDEKKADDDDEAEEEKKKKKKKQSKKKKSRDAEPEEEEEEEEEQEDN